MKNPSPFVRFNDFGSSFLDFEVYFWTKELFRVGDVKSELCFKIDELFRAHNVVVAFPQTDIHIKSPLKL